MYIWRFPYFTGVAIAISSAVLVVCTALLEIRVRVRSQIIRGICSAGVLLALFACPVLVIQAIEPALAAARAHRSYIDQGPEPGWSAAALVLLVLVSSHFLFPRRPLSSRTFRWRSAFAALVVGFVVMNAVNWCSPGWCERFGFPFPYQWWSDGIIEMNGENLTAGWSLVAAIADVVVLIAASAALVVFYRRASARAAAQASSR
jgi:hypothetical protein